MRNAANLHGCKYVGPMPGACLWCGGEQGVEYADAQNERCCGGCARRPGPGDRRPRSGPRVRPPYRPVVPATPAATSAVLAAWRDVYGLGARRTATVVIADLGGAAAAHAPLRTALVAAWGPPALTSAKWLGRRLATLVGAPLPGGLVLRRDRRSPLGTAWAVEEDAT